MKVKINMDIQQSTGLMVCANLIFLCCLFTVVQCNHDKNHPMFFLHKAAMQRSDAISRRPLLDMVQDEQAELVSFVVIE